MITENEWSARSKLLILCRKNNFIDFSLVKERRVNYALGLSSSGGACVNMPGAVRSQKRHRLGWYWSQQKHHYVKAVCVWVRCPRKPCQVVCLMGKQSGTEEPSANWGSPWGDWAKQTWSSSPWHGMWWAACFLDPMAAAWSATGNIRNPLTKLNAW